MELSSDRMAGTDDPCFLRLIGPAGREFRLDFAHGRAMRRGHIDEFVLGAVDDPDTNVAHAELNDPTHPPIPIAGIERVSLVKGLEPIPNVRGIGEMDDRLEFEAVTVSIYTHGSAKPVQFHRPGPMWLGLICGLSVELSPVDAS